MKLARRKNGWWRWPIGVAAGIVVLLLAVVFYMFRIEPQRLELRRYEVRLHCWWPEHDGLTFMIIGDLHQRGGNRELRRLQRIVTLANSCKPDVVLLLGDFIGSRTNRDYENASPEVIAASLHGLRSRYGVFAVLGNHDWWYNGERMRRALTAVGVKVLENEFYPLEIAGRTCNIIGLPDRTTRHERFDRRQLPDPSVPAVVLSHDPDFFPELELPYELMLSGHTHGGQIVLPGIGLLVAPSRYGNKYVYGLVEEEGRRLLVTSGTGTSIIHARLFCPPEIVLLTVKKADSSSAE
ncbi:MAG: metallophosphoesterase [Victivallales bacterium]|nr:metallophosphoesterase [Victivallales bacterium]